MTACKSAGSGSTTYNPKKAATERVTSCRCPRWKTNRYLGALIAPTPSRTYAGSALETI